jgi:hypothetical protein
MRERVSSCRALSPALLAPVTVLSCAPSILVVLKKGHVLQNLVVVVETYDRPFTQREAIASAA